MSEPIRIDELDWTDLEGKTMNATIQVMKGRAYLIEGQQVHVVDLSAGKVQEELPFFGPRSTRTGRLTAEQERALDVLIEDGYTIHRAAMLLGISDSTVSHRRRQLKEGGTPTVRNEVTPPKPRVVTGPQARLSDTEISNIKYLFFIAGEHPTDIATRLKRGQSTVQAYIRRMDEGLFEQLPPLPPVGYQPVINHQAIPSAPPDPEPAPTPIPVVAIVAEPPDPEPEPLPEPQPEREEVPVGVIGKHVPVTEEEITTIFRLRSQGMTTEQIAQAVRRGTTTVKRYLNNPPEGVATEPAKNGQFAAAGAVGE